MGKAPPKTDLAADEDVVLPITGSVNLQDANSRSVRDVWGDLAKLLCIVVGLALCERTLLFQPYNIPSGSMESTLMIGDYLFVEKFAYGYSRYSMPFGRHLPGFGRILFHAPERGDVVVFVPPNDPGMVYIKRVIGLPGDTVGMIDGVLYLNGRAVPKVPDGGFADPDRTDGNVIAQYSEVLPDGRRYHVLDREANSPGDNTLTVTVPPGHFFMMGDNRDDSNDSRMDVGFVPAENLVGKAQFRFFSIDAEKTKIWQFWTWPRAIRFERIFTRIR